MLAIFRLCDVPPTPSSTDIALVPALVGFVGVLLWFFQFMARRQDRSYKITKVFAYVVTFATAVVSFFVNEGFFDPLVWNDAGYWNNRARFVLIFSLSFPIVLVGIYFLVDHFEGKRLASDLDEMSVDYGYGKRKLDEDDE